ncbi:hypothetical protein SADUNF_Sadunf06G0151400 [Salix dunnii]|uniref:RING-type E3 ubiquitin transferase n=1 Tax=Salix dunnii TaxID=1413687 RepID=A0A835K4U5_9ROSI|nr:hypothetical protein SADUNF_Sadunf06G0151400 [Salix dunnii]
MAPGGSAFKEVLESHSTVADCDVANSKSENNITPTKGTVVLGGKHGFYSNNGVHELLECPVCTNLMYPPIHQCPNGHTLCSNCKLRVHNCCPTCHYDLGNIRCLALEKVAESLELPCKFQSLGCLDIFPYYCKLKHEQHCRFRPYSCPYAGSECSVSGDIPALVSHLKDDHKVDMHDGCTFNHRYVKSNPHEVENATWMLTVFNCFGRQFCLHFEAFQLGMAPVYMAFLRFMGDDNEAKKFSYSLEVGGNGRKMVWQGIPRSIRDSHRKVRDSQDGLIIQRNLALYFSGGDRQELKLRVTGRDAWVSQCAKDVALVILIGVFSVVLVFMIEINLRHLYRQLTVPVDSISIDTLLGNLQGYCLYLTYPRIDMFCCGDKEEEPHGPPANQYTAPLRGGNPYGGGSGRGEPRSVNPARNGAPQKVLPIEIPAIPLDELNRMTGNFGTKALIGEGSYGRVFYAKLSDSMPAAIKKLDTSSSQEPDSDFASQLSVVSRLKHEHFVELMGYCLDANNRILVYQFAVMGSLHDVLHGRKGVQGAEPGSWEHLATMLQSKPRIFTDTSPVATPRLSEDKVKQCVDPKLNNDYPPKAVAKLAAVAALCVQYEADFRPNMTIVVKALQPLLNSKPAGPHADHT